MADESAKTRARSCSTPAAAIPTGSPPTPREAFALMLTFGLAEASAVARRARRSGWRACPSRRASPSGSSSSSAARPTCPARSCSSRSVSLRRRAARLRPRQVRLGADRRRHRRQLPRPRPHARALRADRPGIPREGDVRRPPAAGQARPVRRRGRHRRDDATSSTRSSATRSCNQGDTIALGTPIFTPYLEIPHLKEYGFKVVSLEQSEMTPQGRHAGSTRRRRSRSSTTRRSRRSSSSTRRNPASSRRPPGDDQADRRPRADQAAGPAHPDRRRLRHVRRRASARSTPRSRRTRSCVYSYSKHFGCTGWRLGVVGDPRGQHHRREDRQPARGRRGRSSNKRYSPLTLDAAGPEVHRPHGRREPRRRAEPHRRPLAAAAAPDGAVLALRPAGRGRHVQHAVPEHLPGPAQGAVQRPGARPARRPAAHRRTTPRSTSRRGR